VSRPDVARKVRIILIQELRCPSERVREGADLGTDLGAGSLDKITVACRIENEFGIKLSDDECAFAQTVGTLIDLVQQKIENRRVR
jgi:acyl carrier protein